MKLIIIFTLMLFTISFFTACEAGKFKSRPTLETRAPTPTTNPNNAHWIE
ncbi:MAG TPA: hypothetical protein QF753_16285 [Victivallales bacterium]|nr:hypothetical protein [Victivallales bacterium]